jgi:DNA-binding beta-propeller fold protein YncE
MKYFKTTVVLVALACVAGQPSPGAAQPPPRTLAVHSIPIKGQPGHFLVHQDRLFVSCFRGDVVCVIDRTTRKPLHEVAAVAGGTPGALIVANDKLFVGQIFANVVEVYDLKTLRPVKQLPLVGGGCFAAAADGKTVYYATNAQNEFHIIDTETYRYETVAYPEGGRGIGINSVALSPDGKRLYLGIQRGGKSPDGAARASGGCFLAVYDLTKRAYLANTYLGPTDGAVDPDPAIPAQMAFAPDGRQLYVGTFQSRAGIQVVDTVTLRLGTSIAFPKGPRNRHFAWVDPLCVSVYRGWLLAVNRNNNELVVVDRGSAQTVARLSFAGDGHALLALTVRDDAIYVGDNEARAVHELNGRDLAALIEAARADGKTRLPVEVTLTVK